MHLACGYNEVFGCRVLQHQPHTLHIVFGISPIAKSIQIAQIQTFLIAACYACCGKRYLTGNERFAPPLTLVVEEYTVDAEHTVRLAVVFGNPETVLLCHTVWRAGIERRCLFLWHFLYKSEEFGGRCLIDTHAFLHTEYTHRFEQPQRAYGVGLGSVFGYVETYLYVALCRQIVYLVWLYYLYDTQ